VFCVKVCAVTVARFRQKKRLPGATTHGSSVAMPRRSVPRALQTAQPQWIPPPPNPRSLKGRDHARRRARHALRSLSVAWQAPGLAPLADRQTQPHGPGREGRRGCHCHAAPATRHVQRGNRCGRRRHNALGFGRHARVNARDARPSSMAVPRLDRSLLCSKSPIWQQLAKVLTRVNALSAGPHRLVESRALYKYIHCTQTNVRPSR
jgi:hypothetical protein